MMPTVSTYFLLSTYCVPDTVLNPLHVLFHLTLISAVKAVIFETDEDTKTQRG